MSGLRRRRRPPGARPSAWVGSATRSAGVPSKTTSPPSWPAPGPRSMIQSACAITAWWCSMTMTDLPESTSRSSRPEQVLDVGQVQARRRLVQDVDAALLPHVRRQLEPLPLAAGQRRQRLPEAQVAEPDVDEPGEDRVRGRRAGLPRAEELLGLGHRHREHLADVAAAELVLEHRRRGSACPRRPRTSWRRRPSSPGRCR